MSDNNRLHKKTSLKFVSFDHVTRLLILVTSLIFVSCSSINLDESYQEAEIGVAPIKDVKKENQSAKQNRKKSQIIEKSISPIEYVKKKQIDEKMILYRSHEPSIYFDYDDFKIKMQYQELIRVTHELMELNPQYTLFVEGHSDERGTTEYNLALGQKRAEAVVRAIEQLGVSRSRIDAISFGEEKPLEVGSSSNAWEKNRRADLTLK